MKTDWWVKPRRELRLQLGFEVGRRLETNQLRRETAEETMQPGFSAAEPFHLE